MSKRITALSGALLLAFSTAQAAEFNMSGFASTGASITDGDESTDYLGISDTWNFNSDSILGLQADVSVTDSFSLTGQVVARGKEHYAPKVEWAFAAYRFSDAFTARVGRVRLPFFLVSEYLEVGYAYPWIRPPQETYQYLTFSAVDGIDGTYNTSVGDAELSLQAYYGNYDEDLFFATNDKEVPSDTKKLRGVVATLYRDWLTLRASHHRAETNISLTGFDELSMLMYSIGLDQAVRDLEIKNAQASFSELGMQIDHENILFIAEWTRLRFDRSLLSSQDSWYTTFGYRLTPTHLIHATYGKVYSEQRDHLRNIPDIPELAELRYGITEAGNFLAPSSQSTTLGWRWDFHDSLDLKVEWQRISPETNSLGTLFGGTSGKDVQVYSIVLDWVF